MRRILGHTEALNVFQQALALDRLHHAWILSGPAGVGKSLVASAVAAALLDPDVDGARIGCGDDVTSHAGRLLDAGTHPDLHLIHRELAAVSKNPRLRERKQLNIPLDLLRETVLGGRTSDGVVHEAAAYRTPVMARAKVFIIDEAERLDLPGQNALLKTLEEPPSATYFFLVTSRPERMLPTIRSRCQHVRLGRLSQRDMDTWFDQNDIASADRPPLSDFADGAPGLADLAVRRDLLDWIQTLDPLLSSLDQGRWTADMVTEMSDRIEAWSKAVVSENTRASKDSANRDGAEMMLRMLAEHARAKLRRQPDEHICAIIDRIAEAERQCQAGLNLKHVLEALTAEWSVTPA
ncbi:MAG: AAA family ATPase [Phycisphaerales bacterium]|jgi:hypothetical protein|nr:AAA family ATPase [Phycisphaerales bacterium]